MTVRKSTKHYSKMARALALIDSLLAELNYDEKFQPVSNSKPKPPLQKYKQGYIYLTSENLSKQFTRGLQCNMVILDTQFVLGRANFEDTVDHLYEIFSSAVMNLYMQKAVFGGEKLRRVENTIEELESIIDGDRPEWRLAFMDPQEETTFAGEVRQFKTKQDRAESIRDIQRACEIIKNAKNIILLNGAGLSVAAGIPDFRSSDGLYNQLDLASLPGITDSQLQKLKSDKQWVFHRDMFKENPMVYYTIREQFFKNKYDPTFSHRTMNKLVESGKVRKIFTQNIDGLLRKSGISPETIVEVHGTFASARCNECGATADMKQYEADLKSEKLPPKCPKCGGPQRPDIVLFGEGLPQRYANEVYKDCENADLLIITGTSLLVGPVNQMVNLVPLDCPRLLVNRDRVGMFLGMFMEDENNREDLFWCGDADDAFRKIADAFDWSKEIERDMQMRRLN